ncbi:MAG: hypothetical protein GQ574_08940 [Crocinitomix sp.]|nr:hypothetical protein [Crocinitomix sp.]
MPLTNIKFDPIIAEESSSPITITITKSRCYVYEITENEPVLTFHDDENRQDNIFVDLESDKYYYITTKVLSYKINNEEFHVPGGFYLEFVNVFNGTDLIIDMNPAQTPLVAYAFHQFISYKNMTQYGDFTIAGTNRQMGLAMGMKLNFMNAAGDVSDVISSSPNAMQTNSWALWGSLANLLVNAINPDTTNYLAFLAETKSTGTSYFIGLYNLVEHQFLSTPSKDNDSTVNLYTLGENQPVYYSPYLQNLDLPEGESPVPNNWSLAVKVHSSGADNFIIAGAAYIVFDKNDRGWLTTNVVAGTPYSSTFCVVLEPNGAPATFSPVVGGGLLGVGFGVVANPAKDNIFFGNFGWGPTECNPHVGSLSRFDLDGNPISPSRGYTKGPSRVQGLNFDNDGNLWVTSWGSQEPFAPANVVYPFENKPSAIVVYLWDEATQELDYDNPIVQNIGTEEDYYMATFDVALHPTNGCMYVSCAGTNHKGLSGVYKCQLEGRTITFPKSWNNDSDPVHARTYEGLRQINFDSLGNVYVGCIATHKSRVAKLDENLIYQDSYRDKINRPWSVTIDKEDTIFAGNFGTELLNNESGKHPTHAQLPYRTTGVTVMKTQGKAIYGEANMLTLPTGGDEVMLANGFSLYGNVKTFTDPNDKTKFKIYQPQCFIPLMRITSSTIDGAGNLWVMNNWKPSATIDLLENPGGDGVVIFLGVASPAE